MLDRSNAKLLIEIAMNKDTPPATRVSACDLLFKTNEMCATDIQKSKAQKAINFSGIVSYCKLLSYELIWEIIPFS